MDKKTAKYFRQTKLDESAALLRAEKEYNIRQDLKTAFTSPCGFMIRKKLNPKTEKEKRAVAMASLWAEWKQKQLGRAIKFEEIPSHALPVYGNLVFPPSTIKNAE